MMAESNQSLVTKLSRKLSNELKISHKNYTKSIQRER